MIKNLLCVDVEKGRGDAGSLGQPTPLALTPLSRKHERRFVKRRGVRYENQGQHESPEKDHGRRYGRAKW